MEGRIPNAARIVLVVLGVPNAIAGAWALVTPKQWFDEFPGIDPRLVAAIPPFNEHLAADAGAGLLASGVIVLFAVAVPLRAVAVTALVGYVTFAVPHALYHILNPAPELNGGEDVVNDIVLVASALVAGGLLVAIARGQPSRSAVAR